MAVTIDLTIRIVAMKPSSAMKVADRIEEAAETVFEDFTMLGRNIGPMSMATHRTKKKG